MCRRLWRPQNPKTDDTCCRLYEGRFLHPHSTDDILFGNTFDKALNLPWGSGPALKLMKHIDSTLEHDLNSSTRPWALSPLISTMPYLAIAPSSDVPAVTKDFPPARPIAENTARLAQHTNGTPGTLDTFKNADKRRAFFRDVARRNEVTFGPEARPGPVISVRAP